MLKSEVEKHFWTTSDGKIFLDYKSYEEKKTTSNLAQQKKPRKMRKFFFFYSTSELDKARAKARIRVNLFTMFYALLCGMYFIKRGSEDAEERRTKRAIEDSR